MGTVRPQGSSGAARQLEPWQVNRYVEGDVEVAGEEIENDMGGDLDDLLVRPPMPILGRSLLYVHSHCVANSCASSMLSMMYWWSHSCRTVRL